MPPSVSLRRTVEASTTKPSEDPRVVSTQKRMRRNLSEVGKGFAATHGSAAGAAQPWANLRNHSVVDGFSQSPATGLPSRHKRRIRLAEALELAEASVD